MKICIVCIVVIVALWINPALAGKKHCKSYLAKLDNIKSQQRQGSSLKRSKSLAKKEKKARKTWWDCETGKTKPKKRKKKSSKAAKHSKTTVYKPQKKASLQKTKKVIAPFNTNNAVVVRSKYQGAQLIAWLKFYKQAPKCRRPSSTQVFAACIEDKRRQHSLFEQHYKPKS